MIATAILVSQPPAGPPALPALSRRGIRRKADRTPGLCLVRAALSHLSYPPEGDDIRGCSLGLRTFHIPRCLGAWNRARVALGNFVRHEAMRCDA